MRDSEKTADQIKIGRLLRKIAKLQEQRDQSKALVEHYKHVLEVQPYLERRFERDEYYV
jgi:hypothetical protein